MNCIMPAVKLASQTELNALASFSAEESISS